MHPPSRMKPSMVRVSLGTAIAMGLTEGRLDAKPTTAYLLTYHPDKCTANCAFCPQARGSTSRADLLSRVTWPAFPIKDVTPRLWSAVRDGTFRRVCIQALNYPGVFRDILFLASETLSGVDVPISVSCQPLTPQQMRTLREAGVDRVSVALDAATPQLFERVKGRAAGGPYTWEGHWRALRKAVAIFGRGRVTTHIIVGLGEKCSDVLKVVQDCVDVGVYPSLFAFTPIPGTRMQGRPQPPIGHYRLIQLAHYLITTGRARYERMKFNGDGVPTYVGLPWDEVRDVIRSGRPFMTSGCPGCNRPYYNERPGGPIYNYPRPLTSGEIGEIERLLRSLLGGG